MFPRRSRLSRESFPAALKGGLRITTPHFYLVASHGPLGYAVVVSKQVARLSVSRHRLKRRVSAILRSQHLPERLVVLARAGAPALTSAQIREELEAGLRQIA